MMWGQGGDDTKGRARPPSTLTLAFFVEMVQRPDAQSMWTKGQVISLFLPEGMYSKGQFLQLVNLHDGQYFLPK